MTIDYRAILPELILGGAILVVLVVDLVLPVGRKWASMPVAMLGVLASLGAVLSLLGDERATFGGAFVVDNFALLFKVFFLFSAVIVLLSDGENTSSPDPMEAAQAAADRGIRIDTVGRSAAVA